MMTEFTCAEFRHKRDAFQLARRASALPVLEVQAGDLIEQLAVIRRQVDEKRRRMGGMVFASNKSDLDHMEAAKVAVWRDLQPVLAQLSVIDPHTTLIDLALGIKRQQPLKKVS